MLTVTLRMTLNQPSGVDSEHESGSKSGGCYPLGCRVDATPGEEPSLHSMSAGLDANDRELMAFGLGQAAILADGCRFDSASHASAVLASTITTNRAGTASSTG